MRAATEHAPLRPRWQGSIGEPVVALNAFPHGRAGPDGLLAGGSEGRVLLFGADGTRRHCWELGDALLDVAASPDGTRVAAVGMASRKLWNAATGELLCSEAAGWSASAGWDENSRSLAVADGKRIRTLGRSGGVQWSSPELASTVTAVLWPRGRLRVAASAYQEVKIFEPCTGRTTHTLRAPGAISGLAASPNGRWVVGGSQDATLHGWKVADGSDFRMAGFPATVSRLAFEDGGRWMACDSAEVLTCWDFSGNGPTGRSAVVLTGHRAAVSSFAWAPGGLRTMVSGDEEGTVLVWRLSAGTRPADELRPVGGVREGAPVTAVAVGAGGRSAEPVAHVGRRSGEIEAMALR